MSLLNLFQSKKSLFESEILLDATDVHCLLLPEVDDGIRSYAESVQALRWLKRAGFSRMIITPHVMSDFKNNNRIFLTEKFHDFLNRIESDGVSDIPELKLAAEYMLEPAFEQHCKDGLLTFADRHVLIETSYIMPPVGLMRILEEIMEDGFSPVLAHPERYAYMDFKDFASLKSQGILFQLNFLSLIGSYGSHARENEIKLLKLGYYNYAGSDFHRLARHRDDFSRKALTRNQIDTLNILFDNNSQLW